MSENADRGILYTDYAGLDAKAQGMASLWSYEAQYRRRDRRRIRHTPDGRHEYWLELFDPLLNTSFRVRAFPSS